MVTSPSRRVRRCRGGACPRGTPGWRRRRSRCARRRPRRSRAGAPRRRSRRRPTTDSPSISVSAWATARVPLGERVELEDAHRAVPEHRLGVGQRRGERRARTPARCRGRSGRRGSASAGTTVAGASAANSGATTMSVGSTSWTPASSARSQVAAAGVELVLLEEALADLVALRLEEGEHHAAADEQLVGLAEQVVDDAELVGDLGAAEHDGVGPLRVLGEPPQHVDLGGDQAAHGVRQPLRDVVHRGLLAVHHPEAVADEGVGERGELVGERAALARRPCWSRPALKRTFSSTATWPSAQPVDGSRGGLPHRVGGERDVGAEQLAEAAARPAPASTPGPALPSGGRGGPSRRPGRRRRPAAGSSARWPGSDRRR